MTHYDDAILSNKVRFGSGSVPLTSTQQFIHDSGNRDTNERWDQNLVELNLSYVDDLIDIYAIRIFWYAMRGPVHSFLVRDWSEWNTTAGVFQEEADGLAAITNLDQPLKNTVTGLFTGDGSTTTFQCGISYVAGSASHYRTVKKLQTGTIVAAEAAVSKSPSINLTTGILTFAPAPANGAAMTWGGAFYVPVHFVADDALRESLRNQAVTELAGLRLMEERGV